MQATKTVARYTEAARVLRAPLSHPPSVRPELAGERAPASRDVSATPPLKGEILTENPCARPLRTGTDAGISAHGIISRGRRLYRTYRATDSRRNSGGHRFFSRCQFAHRGNGASFGCRLIQRRADRIFTSSALALDIFGFRVYFSSSDTRIAHQPRYIYRIITSGAANRA